MTPIDARLIVVSNRLPFVLTKQNGGYSLKAGSGGLVTALAPVLRHRGGMWIGWHGQVGELPDMPGVLAGASARAGYDLVTVNLSRQEYDQFYLGYANATLWPLFHDLQWQCQFSPDFWQGYQAVNRKFAESIMLHGQTGDFIWVHDYHLMGVAQFLRESGYKGVPAFFLHIPFPPLDIYIKLPERHKLLNALLHYDLIGFQTHRDRQNFNHCVRKLIPGARVTADGSLGQIQLGEREVRVGVFPIGIDFKAFARQAASISRSALYQEIRQARPRNQIVLGVDRLDYTKGIPQRMEAFRLFLRRYPEWREKVKLLQVVVPSRVGIPKYDALKVEIERLAGEINGEFSNASWVPIHYCFRSLSPQELVSYYRLAEVALITPLKDGMNLVCKEYCAANTELGGVLILSEFAGAAAQLRRHALLVNPYDAGQTADAIHQALQMPKPDRRDRMRTMRRLISLQDVYWWVDSFMQAAINRELEDFPVIDEYLPEDPETCSGLFALGG